MTKFKNMEIDTNSGMPAGFVLKTEDMQNMHEFDYDFGKP